VGTIAGMMLITMSIASAFTMVGRGRQKFLFQGRRWYMGCSGGPSPENMEIQLSKTVLAVVNDLFFSAKINEAAKRAGVTLKYVTTEKDLLEKAKADPALIIFDLNFEAVRPIESIRKLKGTDELKHINLLGYLSHVQTDLQRLAQEAGCDTVMPRSAFSMNLSQILMRHAGAGA
jgi:PleD family two-component response regulator